MQFYAGFVQCTISGKGLVHESTVSDQSMHNDNKSSAWEPQTEQVTRSHEQIVTVWGRKPSSCCPGADHNFDDW